MTKCLLIVVALRSLAASAASYHAMTLDLGEDIEDCASKNVKDHFMFGLKGDCVCGTNFEPDKVCIMPIHKDRVTRNYGQNGLLGSENVKSLLVPGKNLSTCRLMVGKPAGFKGCSIMYAAYLCKGREACDDGDCQVFCGFYPKITDGVTLQSFYPKVSGSAQGAWGFVEAGITCDASTPPRTCGNTGKPRCRTSPHDACAWTTSGGDQERVSMKWGADATACCMVVCSKHNCGEGKYQARHGYAKLPGGQAGGCCEPCPDAPEACPKGPPVVIAPKVWKWTVWKTYSKCKKTADYKANKCADGKTCYKSVGSVDDHSEASAGFKPYCMDGAAEANKQLPKHDFVIAKDGKNATGDDCYSVADCVEFETGLKDKWIIYTRRNISELEASQTLKKEGESCSAFNVKDCSDGLICDNTKDPASPGEGVCTSRSKGVTGNTCVALPSNCAHHRKCVLELASEDKATSKCYLGNGFLEAFENCPVENLMQCSAGSACSSLAISRAPCSLAPCPKTPESSVVTVGKCEACDKVFGELNASLELKRQFRRGGCPAFANGYGAGRCAAMPDMCPSIGKCLTKMKPIGGVLFVSPCYPVPKDCHWYNDQGICWACPKGFAAKWNQDGMHATSPYGHTCSPTDFGNTRGGALCNQCDYKCKSGFSYALSGGISKTKAATGKSAGKDGYMGDAPLPEHAQYDCPAGYEQISVTSEFGTEGNGGKGYNFKFKDTEYKQGCCKKLPTTSQPPTTTVKVAANTMKGAVVGQKQVTTFKDLDFASMTEALKKGVVDAVCVATVAKNEGGKCTGVASKGSVVVTTTVTGVTGKLKNAAATDVLTEVKKVPGLSAALVVAGKTLNTMDAPSIADSVPITTAPTNTAAVVEPSASGAFRGFPLPSWPIQIAGLAACIWQ